MKGLKIRVEARRGKTMYKNKTKPVIRWWIEASEYYLKARSHEEVIADVSEIAGRELKELLRLRRAKARKP